MIVQDESGRQWVVQKGDPAWDEANWLARRGMKRLVMPVEILTGRPDEPRDSSYLQGRAFEKMAFASELESFAPDMADEIHEAGVRLYQLAQYYTLKADATGSTGEAALHDDEAMENVDVGSDELGEGVPA